MSKFPEPPKDATFVSGRPIGGTFECDICGKPTNEAVHNAREQKLYWVCPDGHENNINFRL